MKKISAIEDIERAVTNLNMLEKQILACDDTKIDIALLSLSIALDKLKELETKINKLI